MQRREDENLTMRALYLLAILFVVDGHLPLPDLLDFGGLFGYYSFHLLLFAFGSGYFFRLHGDVLQDGCHRAKKLLVPLYVWNLIYGLLAAVLRRFGGFTLGAPLSPYTLLLAPVTDGEHFIWNLGAWFLFPLFAAQVLYSLIRRIPGFFKKDARAAFLVCLAAGMAAEALFHYGTNRPLWLLRTLFLLPGYAGGALYRERLEEKDKLPALPYLSGLVLARALLLACCGSLSYLLSSGTYFARGPVVTFLGAALAIAFWVRIARLIAPAVAKCRPALFAARHTMDIMMHHYMGFFAFNLAFLFLNKFGIAAQDFSVSAFRSQSGYVYAPGNSAGFTVLYLLWGLALPLGFAWLRECTVRRLRARPSGT
ncbi:MAG: hypothetical protein IJ573_07310 [Clostridia bacterium]|nr:hypothetical protein [Clostridia bacterium]